MNAHAQQITGEPGSPSAITTVDGRYLAAMPSYHCFFLDSADQIAATLSIDCKTDNEAQARADKLLAVSDHIGIEVWIGGRRLYRARKPDAIGCGTSYGR